MIFKLIFNTLLLCGAIGSCVLAFIDHSFVWLILGILFSLIFNYKLLAHKQNNNVNNENNTNNNTCTLNGSFFNNINQS